MSPSGHKSRMISRSCLLLSGAVKRAIMNRYNLSDQKATSWLNRAEICVSFILRDLQIREVERVIVADPCFAPSNPYAVYAGRK